MTTMETDGPHKSRSEIRFGEKLTVQLPPFNMAASQALSIPSQMLMRQRD